MRTTTTSKIFILFILGSLSTVTPFAIDLYLPAFGQLSAEFETTIASISLSVSSYFVGMALGQMLYGPLLDRFGRKPPLYVGLFVFVLASFGCMASNSVDMLITFRFFQALGGSVAWVAAVTMVRDFFPVKESANVFSLLVLIIGVSPLLAPTLGGFISDAWGWRAVFIVLACIAVCTVMLVLWFLPDGQPPDSTVSLRAKPMIMTFFTILKEPQFFTYSFANAFSFATLFIYVAGSPIIFMEYYGVSPKVYGGIFALLSVGFIGASQLNILLTRKYRSDRIFKIALTIQALNSIVFLIAILNGILGLYSTIGMLFVCLSCVGAMNPNANALALAPFTRNIGSASALLGFTQIGVAALASSGVGLFESKEVLPVVILLVITSSIAWLVLFFGYPRIKTLTLGHVDDIAVGGH
ncbi:MAG: multidrug effflux MFS transporter [Chryseolinea sp.]